MTDNDRWQEIDELFEAALELQAAQRDAFLSERCSSADVRVHVERLLAI